MIDSINIVGAQPAVLKGQGTLENKGGALPEIGGVSKEGRGRDKTWRCSLNRVASTSSVNEARPAINELAYWQQLIATIQLPPYVWIVMVLLAAAGLCYSLTLHTSAEFRLAAMEREQAGAEVKQLEIENMRLARELEAVEKDPRTIEVLAREAGMVAAGESVVLIEQSPRGSQPKARATRPQGR